MITPKELRQIAEAGKTQILLAFQGALEKRLKEAASLGLFEIKFCLYDEKESRCSEDDAKLLAAALAEKGFDASFCEKKVQVRTGMNEYEEHLMPALLIKF